MDYNKVLQSKNVMKHCHLMVIWFCYILIYIYKKMTNQTHVSKDWNHVKRAKWGLLSYCFKIHFKKCF